ncbi:MAG TPA: glycosyltransferase family A protein [Bauldia sp.]|nr:glycosyltransferase family A protein [Bauldia sp.]
MISVVIPTFNGRRYLASAIRSVLAQTLAPDEVVVADDGSEDGSAAIAQGFGAPVRVLALPHRGLPATLNDAVAAARGDVLAFLDDDDLWAPEKLALQVRALAADPELEAVFCHMVQFTDRAAAIADPSEIPAAVRPRAKGIAKSCMLIRRASFDRVGPFDPGSRLADFIEWYQRATAAGLRVRVLDEVLAFRRRHGRNTSLTQAPALHARYLTIARGAIARRRGPATAD